MFRHCLFVLTGVVISVALTGCQTDISSGTRLSLGDVSYDEALTVAREVMRKHFELAPGNPGDSEIVALPRPVDANATVRLQRQGAAGFEQFGADGNYSTIPNETPSQKTAATTPQQNEAWETRARDRGMERTIVHELYDALHPGKTP